VKTYWLDPNRALGRDFQEQFQREIEILFSLQHPCIVSLVGYSLPIGQIGPRIAMPYIGPDSLHSVLESTEKPSWWTVTTKRIVIIGIAVAMYPIQTAGIRHQDLKPSNILLDPVTHFAKVVDFGPSQFEAARCTMTFWSGSPRYMAPELYSEESATQKVDVFSFSVILYEILTGQSAFRRTWSRSQLMNCVCSGNRPDFPRNCLGFLQELIQWCWQQKPENRPSFKIIVNRLRDQSFRVFHGADSTQVQRFLGYLT
jgi:serine/threonine protein kinase